MAVTLLSSGGLLMVVWWSSGGLLAVFRWSSGCLPMVLRWSLGGHQAVFRLSSCSLLAVFWQTSGHLICTLISENQGLDKLRSVSKISGTAQLNFFSVCHLDFFQVYGTNLKKNQLTNWKKFRSTEKKFRCPGPEIFLRFETDLNFSRPWFSEIKVQIKWPRVQLSPSYVAAAACKIAKHAILVWTFFPSLKSS